MLNMPHIRLMILGIVAMPLIYACSDGVSKSEIATAINAKINTQTACFSLAENNVEWPVRVRRPMGLSNEPPLDPILIAMRAAGYLKISTTQNEIVGMFGMLTGKNETVDTIMPTDEAKRWWDVKSGYCLGKRGVADIQEWTVPGKDAAVTAIQVTYTWHLVDVPAWAEHKEFKKIKGMGTPVPDMAILQKTSNGWKAVF